MSEIDLNERIRIDLNLSDKKTIQALVYGMQDATGYQEQLAEIHDHGMTLKEYREKITRLHNALAKLERDTADTEGNLKRAASALQAIPARHRRLLDTVDKGFYFSEPWEPNISRFERVLCKLMKLSKSDRQRTAAQLRTIVQAVQKDVATPGQGGARKQAKRYTMAIQCLAQHFQEAMPRHPITAKPESLFSRYVTLWFEWRGLYVGQPDRHIQNALVDLSKWKKLTL